jgi:hypothetical protein
MMKIILYLMLAVAIFTSLRGDWRHAQWAQDARLEKCGRKEWLSSEQQVKRWEADGRPGTLALCN